MELFQSDMEHLQKKEQQLEKKYSYLSSWRLLVFLLGCGSLGAGLQYRSNYLGYAALLCLVFFLALIIYHLTVQDKLNHIRELIKVNQDYLNRIQNNWWDFPDEGLDLTGPEHAYAYDLDVVGKFSLFQFLNTTRTFLGREHLARLLLAPEQDRTTVESRQKAVDDLTPRIAFCRNFQAEALVQKDAAASPHQLIQYCQKENAFFNHNGLRWGLAILPVITLALLLVLYILPGRLSLYAPMGLILLQIAINLAGDHKKSPVLFELYRIRKALQTSRRLLHLIKKEKFSAPSLISLQSTLLDGKHSALSGLKKLDYIAGATDLRSNFIIYFLANTFLMWDYHCLFALEKWKIQYGRSLEKWLQLIGEIEAYMSLAVIPQTNSTYCYPEFIRGTTALSAKHLKHPLISQTKVVGNSLDIRGQTALVTGSNMSGKTTLLRTVGINLVLAYAGAPVLAKSMECGIMNIFTSMRIADDLNRGVSTFYAELLRVKTMVEFAALKKPMLFLIDEIFKGTNSRDRLIGAKSLIISLNKPWITGMVSTHDLDLCSLENEPGLKIKNYYFTEHYVGDDIRFDYQLQPGLCNTSNARHLMRLAGLEIIE